MSQPPDTDREWQLQEQARLQERRGAGGASGDLAQYRLIARALRNPPLEALPPDFAASTAAQVEPLEVPVNDRLEMWLQRLLLAILLLVGLAVLAQVGSDWILLAASGIGLSLLVELVWRSRSQSGLSRAL